MSAEFRDENERLVAEPAVLVYRSTVEAMRAAPHGQGMACMEQTLRDHGRDHLRLILERAASAYRRSRSAAAWWKEPARRSSGDA